MYAQRQAYFDEIVHLGRFDEVLKIWRQLWRSSYAHANNESVPELSRDRQ